MEQSSFVDVSTAAIDGELFVGVPLSASLFGRKKVVVSPWKTAVESDVDILRMFGAARASDVQHGLAPRVESLFRSAADRLVAGDERADDLMPVIELVCQSYPPARLRLADVFVERGEYDRAIEATRRYLQERPDDQRAWRKLALLARQSGDPQTELQAVLEAARIPGSPYGEISDAANRFNELLRSQGHDLAADEKRLMVERLRRMMESRLPEANATDLSRLGWLCVHLGDVDAARGYALRGLERDPSNYYCIRLAELQQKRPLR